jgi:hypothetical protein
MKNLEDAQREMRERNARKKREEDLVQPETVASDDSPEVLRLKSQISALITENTRLRQQRRSWSSDLVGKTNPTGILLRNNSTTSLNTATREDTRFFAMCPLSGGSDEHESPPVRLQVHATLRELADTRTILPRIS